MLKIILGIKNIVYIEKNGTALKFQQWIDKPCLLEKYTEIESSSPTLGEKGVHFNFTFLNLSKQFKSDEIIWDESEYGKLWVYNLNYMDYLLQPNIEKETGLKIITIFIKNLHNIHIALEPYPISLRGINWIKFFSKHALSDSSLSSYLYAQYKILLKNIEYHILANHLLENGFSLLFGSFFFKDISMFNKAEKIISIELNEQILEDGAHFELSPMYHQIVLDRLLDCINLLQNNYRFDRQTKVLKLMQQKAQLMLSWLNIITFSNGNIPLLNDASPDIAPNTIQINNYAKALNIKPINSNFKLSASGYRKFANNKFECIIDVGEIGSSYQPGHAHADTFNFVINVSDQPVVIDIGISTYNTCGSRFFERSTTAHNTVTVRDNNSSEVWSSFRVGRRAKVELIKDNKRSIIARHNGYRNLKTVHQREWAFSEESIEVFDTLQGNITEGKAHIWLSPQINPQKKINCIVTERGLFSFENASSIDIIQKKIPNGYNRYSITHKLEITFIGKLKTTFKTL
jgi:hypothetical protein